MSSGCRPASFRARCAMQPMIGLPSGLERVRWKASAISPQPSMHAEDFGAAGLGGIVAFQHQGAGAFRHDEAVAVLGERPRRALRIVVAGRQRRQQRKADQRFRIDRAVGANAERGVGFAAADRFDAELDRARARSAGGRQRNRRALGAEFFGQWSATEPNRKRVVIVGKLRGSRAAVGVGHLVIGAGLGAQGPSRCGHSISIGGTARNSGPGKSPSSRCRIG